MQASSTTTPGLRPGVVLQEKKSICMALTKDKKKSLTELFSDIVKNAKSVVFAQFDKLTVAQSEALRRNLRTEGTGYKVVKKTLLKRALADAGFEGEMPELPGEIAVAYGEDLLAPARGVYSFHKENKENIKIVGGVFEGKFMDMAAMNSIATIPPLQVLRGQFVNLINSPIQRFAVAVSEIAKKKA